jgi:hypothetical protein
MNLCSHLSLYIAKFDIIKILHLHLATNYLSLLYARLHCQVYSYIDRIWLSDWRPQERRTFKT